MTDQNESQLFDKNALLEEFKDEADILQVAIEIFTQKYETILQARIQYCIVNPISFIVIIAKFRKTVYVCSSTYNASI